jgi:hypothetical protein
MGLALDLLLVLLIGAVSAATIRLLICGPIVWNWLADEAAPALRRRWRARYGTPLPLPTGTRPIQEIGVRVRRIGAQYYGGAPGRSWVKTDALRRAYDESLDEGCRALEIDTDLLALDPGTERDAERMRVEYLLTDAGLVLRDRPAA